MIGELELDSIKDYIVVFIFWSILAAPFLIAALLVLFAVVIALLSPVAALVSGVLAYRRGLNAIRYAAVGLLYSVMLGFPWLFLTLGMIDRSLPRVIARVLYFFTFAAWLFCILVGIIISLFLFNGGRDPLVAQVSVPFFTIINGVLWMYSLSGLSKNGVAMGKLSEERTLFPYPWYMFPFACIFVFIALPLLYLGWLEYGVVSLPELVQIVTSIFKNVLKLP